MAISSPAPGLWPSPFSAKMVAENVKHFNDLSVAQGIIYYVESRPDEDGRNVLMANVEGVAIELLPEEHSVRTRVHEYGGNGFVVDNDNIYFINDADQRLYCKKKDNDVAECITPKGIRFADLSISMHGILCVAEDHRVRENQPENFIALINPQDKTITPVHQGHDFYGFPTLSADAKKIAFIAWDHPNMPWDDTFLYQADFDGQCANLQQVDADEAHQSFFQPRWNDANQLYVLSDKNNWWNLYRVENSRLDRPLFEIESDLGVPLWMLGLSRWAFLGDDIICTFAINGKSKLYRFNEQTDALTPFDNTDKHDFNAFDFIHVDGGKVVCLANGPKSPTSIISMDEHGKIQVLAKNRTITFPECISVPRHLSFDSDEGRTAYAYYYPPHNPNHSFTGPAPLVVRAHGGPTANCGSRFNLGVQYWTSRGFAYLDVNYGGSSGYGRAFRQSLHGQWGIVDVQDCIRGVQHCILQGWVDPNKVAITGGSAGGYTTLKALTDTDLFCAGASHYGVSNCLALAQDTHKFESRYLDGLIGTLPEDESVYHERSPLNRVTNMSSPVILFQGDEDKVVPLNQAEQIYQALQEKGLDCELHVFEGEGHGFDKAANIVFALKNEERFFLESMGLKKKAQKAMSPSSRPLQFSVVREVEPEWNIDNRQNRPNRGHRR